MINALIKGKFSLNHQLKEDSLTSCVFDYLLLLPDEMIWDILKKANLKNSCLPKHVGQLNDIDYWPKWSTKEVDSVYNKNYVEPDVFIEFEDAFVIVEAKRYDEKQQNPEQWRSQIETFLANNDYDLEQKELIYFAIGGIYDENIAKIVVNNQHFKVYKIGWIQLLNVLNIYNTTLSTSKELTPNINSYLRIIKTIIESLAIHGYFLPTYKWLQSLNYNKKQSIKTSTKTLLQWKAV